MRNRIKYIIVLLFYWTSVQSQSWARVQLVDSNWLANGGIRDPILNGIFFHDTGILISAQGDIIHSNNYFNSFSVDTTFYNDYLDALSFPNRNTGYITSTYAPGGLIKTEDGGNTWYSPFPPNFPRLYAGNGNTLYFSSPTRGYCADNALCILNTTSDGGNIWYDTTNQLGIGGFCEAIIQLKGVNDSIIYILANNNDGGGLSDLYLFRSTNYGHNWVQVSNTFLFGWGDFYIIDDTTIIACGSDGVSKSRNGGQTFSIVLPDSDVDGDYLASEHVIWFSGHDTGFLAYPAEVFKTYDAGDSWIKTDFQFDSADPYNSIAFLTGASAQNVIVGCEDGDIYKTETGGGVWSGIQNVPKQNSFALYPNPTNRKLYGTINNSQKSNLQIFAIDGREAMPPVTIQQNHFEIDVSSLPAGLYFIQLQSDEGRVVRKFVKE